MNDASGSMSEATVQRIMREVADMVKREEKK